MTDRSALLAENGPWNFVSASANFKPVLDSLPAQSSAVAAPVASSRPADFRSSRKLHRPSPFGAQFLRLLMCGLVPHSVEDPAMPTHSLGSPS